MSWHVIQGIFFHESQLRTLSDENTRWLLFGSVCWTWNLKRGWEAITGRKEGQSPVEEREGGREYKRPFDSGGGCVHSETRIHFTTLVCSIAHERNKQLFCFPTKHQKWSGLPLVCGAACCSVNPSTLSLSLSFSLFFFSLPLSYLFLAQSNL